MPRKERRAKVLAERKQRKKGRTALDGAAFEWMATLLPAAGGRVLEVAADPKGTAALEDKGWRVVPVDAGALLAQGDFAGETVDAVTCWLLEPPRGRADVTGKLAAMGMRTADEARLALQTLVHRLADRVLRPGGVLQIVDHVIDPIDEALAGGRVRLQRAQAKGTSLEFASLDVKPLGAGALVSVRSRKT
jgi:predicted methyltransferase